MTGLLVTGTDTGVGKTECAVRLVRGLVARGLSVGVMKPCETGVPDGPAGQLPAGTDAARLLEASGSAADPADVRPFAYELPAAPTAAAAAVGTALDLPRLDASFERLRRAHDVVLVEGAGGLLVPLVGGFDFADLAARWRLPLVIVARSGLGTLNHTTLTVRHARARGLDVLGVVIDEADGPTSASDRANLAELAGLIAPTPILAEIPHGGEPDAEDWARALEVVAPGR